MDTNNYIGNIRIFFLYDDEKTNKQTVNTDTKINISQETIKNENASCEKLTEYHLKTSHYTEYRKDINPAYPSDLFWLSSRSFPDKQ